MEKKSNIRHISVVGWYPVFRQAACNLKLQLQMLFPEGVKMDLRQVLTFVIGIAGLIWYYICLCYIGFRPLPAGRQPDNFRQFMSISVTTIGVSLATFVGMLIGVQGVSQNIKNKVAAIADPNIPGLKIQTLLKISWTTSFQWWAAGFYVLSLFVAIAFWWQKRDQADPAISNLAKSLLGLIGGALAIILNLPS
jgi:hypothetical protein